MTLQETTTTIEFYYPHTGKWYRFIDKRIDDKLQSRICQEIKTGKFSQNPLIHKGKND